MQDSGLEVNIVTDSQYALGIIQAQPDKSESELVSQIIEQLIKRKRSIWHGYQHTKELEEMNK